MLSNINTYSKALKTIKCSIGGGSDRSMEQNRSTRTNPNICNN